MGPRFGGEEVYSLCLRPYMVHLCVESVSFLSLADI